MATPNRKVIDISHWNPVTSWSSIVNAGIVGVINKATEGTYYRDNTYLKNCAPCYQNGLCWGAYHFGTNENAQSQADFFLSMVGVDNETLYALDWEDNPSGATMTAATAKAFIQAVEKKIGENRCVVYSGNTAKQALGSSKDSWWGAHRLWLAQYSSSPVPQASWDSYWLWQYSDGQNGPNPHNCPGVSGDCDTNSYAGADDQLVAEWTGAPPPPAPVAEAEVDITIAAKGDVQVTINGQTFQVSRTMVRRAPKARELGERMEG
jgi:lysozyme